MSNILWAQRKGKKHYVGQNGRGAKVEIGMGENQFTPGELLQLALATCHTFSADHVFAAALGKDFGLSNILCVFCRACRGGLVSCPAFADV